jgi:hypothetical protein
MTGNIVLEILGFDQYKQTSRMNSGGARPTDPGVPLEWIPAEYQKVHVDNISIAVNKSKRENEPQGVTFVSQQEKFFTTSAETIDILFADADKKMLSRSGNEFVGPTRPTRGDDLSSGQIGILYRAFDADNVTVSWSDGRFIQMPIGNVLAKTILTAYQKPVKIFEGDFLSGDLTFLNVLEVDLLPDHLYIFLSAEFDLLNNKVERGLLCEIVSKSIKTIDSNFDTLPNGLPPLVQNPNAPSNATPTGSKIFTQQFNDVFS